MGVEFVLTNTGTSTYSDSPSNGAKLISKGDQQFDSTILSEGPHGGSFASTVKIAPGAKRQGCIPFEVTRGVKVKTLQLALDSGFADEFASERFASDRRVASSGA